MGKEKSEGIKVPAGQRTYFIDVKEAKNGNKYLVFTESKKTPKANLTNRE